MQGVLEGGLHRARDLTGLTGGDGVVVHLADEVFVSGTAAELTPLREIDDHTIGEGHPGDITRAVQTGFEDALHGRTERYREWLDAVPVPSAAPQVA